MPNGKPIPSSLGYYRLLPPLPVKGVGSDPDLHGIHISLAIKIGLGMGISAKPENSPALLLRVLFPILPLYVYLYEIPEEISVRLC